MLKTTHTNGTGNQHHVESAEVKPDPARYLRIKEGAEYLNVSVQKVVNLISAGQIAFIRFGPKTRRLDILDLDRYADSCKVQAKKDK